MYRWTVKSKQKGSIEKPILKAYKTIAPEIRVIQTEAKPLGKKQKNSKNLASVIARNYARSLNKSVEDRSLDNGKTYYVNPFRYIIHYKQ